MTPIWLWPNLLSLDAPLVAVLWQWLFAKALGARLRFSETALLASCTWSIYVLDRLMDARRAETRFEPGERHRFYSRHGRKFLPALLAGSVCSAAIALFALPRKDNPRGLLLAVLVGVYLLCANRLKGFPKEAAAGFLFAAGVTLPFWQRLLGAGTFGITSAILFGAACVLNMAAIGFWESLASGRLAVSQTAEWMGRHLLISSLLLAVLAFGLSVRSETFRPVYAAVGASAFAFLCVARLRPRQPLDVSCALIDAALLSPLLTGIHVLINR